MYICTCLPFPDLVAELLNANVRALVYNGDTDFMVDWIGSKKWTMDLEWSHKTEFQNAKDFDYHDKGVA